MVDACKECLNRLGQVLYRGKLSQISGVPLSAYLSLRLPI